MTRKMYWGFAILILLMGTAAVFIIMHKIAENRELKDQLAEMEKLANQINQREISKNNPPPAEPGFRWVWHNDHWDKVPISNPNGPVVHHHVPIADVSTENVQTSEETNLYRLEGKPIDEDFYREYIKSYSRERLQDNLKSYQKAVGRNRTGNIPILMKSLKKNLAWSDKFPDCEHTRNMINEIKADIKYEQDVVNRMEEHISLMSKVLNEKENHDEK